MSISSIVFSILMGIISIGCFFISILQFMEKGFLFNNAYLYASKEQREKMNKSPHYRQSAITFLLVGLIFLTNSINSLMNKEWLFCIVMILVVVVLLYAIISSVWIKSDKG